MSHPSRSRALPPPCKRPGSWWESCRLHTWSTEHGRSSSGHAWFPDKARSLNDAGVLVETNMNSHPHPVTLVFVHFVPRSSSSSSSHPCDLLFALGAVWSVSIIVALGTIDGASLLEEPPLVENLLTLWAGKLLWVPGAPQCHQVPTPGITHKHLYLHILQPSSNLQCDPKWRTLSGLSPLPPL